MAATDTMREKKKSLLIVKFQVVCPPKHVGAVVKGFKVDTAPSLELRRYLLYLWKNKQARPTDRADG